MRSPHLLLGALVLLAAGCGEQADDRDKAPPQAEATVPEPEPEPDTGAAEGPAPEFDMAEHEPAGDRPPERVWQLYCVECHAPGGGHPGTMMLAEKKGAQQSVILGREDLTPEYIEVVVRTGLLEMTPFRPTEITDEELAALAEYVRSTPPAEAPHDIDG